MTAQKGEVPGTTNGSKQTLSPRSILKPTRHDVEGPEEGVSRRAAGPSWMTKKNDGRTECSRALDVDYLAAASTLQNHFVLLERLCGCWY